MKKKWLVIFLMTLVFGVTACATTTTATNNLPVISGTETINIPLFSSFSPREGISASDGEDGDLTSSVVIVENTVDTTVAGNYWVRYSVTDRDGNTVFSLKYVSVVLLPEEDYPLAQYPEGIDVSRLPIADQSILISALEEYLLEHVYAGVPLLSTVSLRLYSDRVQLPWVTYNSNTFFFGDLFSELTGDDTTVHLVSGEGVPGNFTWREAYLQETEGWNPWKDESSNSQDFTAMICGALYDDAPDDSGTGITIVPSLAEEDPIPLDPQTGDDGILRSAVWEIPLRDDLEWMFDSSTDTSHLPAGYQTLDASDFLWTWKYALDHHWFEAYYGINGLSQQGIKGVVAYKRGEIAWSGVGLSVINGNSLRIEYDEPKTELDILYYFKSKRLAPVCQELLEAVGEENYGTSPETVASSGIAYLAAHQVNSYIQFGKNPHHPDAASIHHTGWEWVRYPDENAVLQAFSAGDLDVASVPNNRKADFMDDPGARIVIGNTELSLNINGFGTVAARDAFLAAHPDSGLSTTYVPEPILQYESMRQALYWGIDRDLLVEAIDTPAVPRTELFDHYYLTDGRTLTQLGGTQEGIFLLAQYSEGAEGHLAADVQSLFHEAVGQGIADGFYAAGTPAQDTVIHLSLLAYETSTSVWATAAQVLKAQLEPLLVDEENHVRVEFDLEVIFYTEYYTDRLFPAAFDLGLSVINPCTLCDSNPFLNYSEGNPNGVMVNFGIDTTSALIPVSYRNAQGKWVYETWSYDALAAALYGSVKVEDGIVVPE